MRAVIEMWDNSLAIRIPKSLAESHGLRAGMEVDLVVKEGRLILTPTAGEYDLDELLKGMTPENCPGEWDTGQPVGNEIW